jgi:uncharacterized protein
MMNLKKRNCINLTLFAMIVFSVRTQAEEGKPSFLCSNSVTGVEKRICQSSPYFNLKQVDRELAQEYRKALKMAPYPNKLIAEQRTWLKTLPICLNNKISAVPSYLCNFTEKQNPDQNITLEYEREQCAQDYCLIDQYNNRIQALQDFQESLMPPFRLARDTGWNVCRDYLKSLETLNPKPESLACDLNIAPNMPQFSLPDWQELNIEEHWEIVYAAESEFITNRVTPLPAIDAWREGYRERIRKGEIKPRLRIAKMRFSSEGPEEIFYGYTQDRDNSESCKKNLHKYPGYHGYTGDRVFYREQVSQKLLGIGFDRPEDFLNDFEHQVVLYKATLFLVSPHPQFTMIHRLNHRSITDFNKQLVKHSYFAQQICQIIIRPATTDQP